jgi:NAD(P)-dependent dehydrogenase (short-subunit alcohol dehydrogenase family)
MRFQNKVVVITGTAGGQGREAAIRFASEGAIIAGCDINSAENIKTQKLVEAAGGKFIEHSPIDLTDERSVVGWIQKVIDATGKIDVLYANAGATKFSPIDKISFDEWQFEQGQHHSGWFHRWHQRICHQHSCGTLSDQGRHHRNGASACS